MKIKGWNLFEIIWLTLFTLVSIVLSVVWKDTILGFSVFLSGVICVVLAAKGNIWTYGFGIYNSLTYAYVSYLNGLYGETMLNALYYFPMQIVGWLLWKKRMQGNTVEMRKLSTKGIVGIAILCIAGTAAYGYWLSTLSGQNTPYVDALTNVLSVMAMLLMAQRYREQWGLFILINVVSIVMWSYRLVNGSQDAATMVAMWSAYLVNSVYGFASWSRGVEKAANLNGNEEKDLKENRGVAV